MDAVIDSCRDPKRRREDDDDVAILEDVGTSIPEGAGCLHPRGGCLAEAVWDIFAVTINLKSPPPEEVRIHGAIQAWSDSTSDYLFRRSKDDPQVFKNPGKQLTLPFQGGPFRPRVLECGFRGVTMLCALQFNDENVFPSEDSISVPVEEWDYKMFIIRNYEDDPDLFGGEAVGQAMVKLSAGPSWGTKDTFYRGCFFSILDPSLEMISGVDGEVGVITVGALQFTVSDDLNLFGEITVCSNHWSENKCHVFFNKTETEGVYVESGKLIPLLRSVAASSCGFSLIVKANLTISRRGEIISKDEEETIFFRAHCTYPFEKKSEKKTMGKGLIEVEATWGT